MQAPNMCSPQQINILIFKAIRFIMNFFILHFGGLFRLAWHEFWSWTVCPIRTWHYLFVADPQPGIIGKIAKWVVGVIVVAVLVVVLCVIGIPICICCLKRRRNNSHHHGGEYRRISYVSEIKKPPVAKRTREYYLVLGFIFTELSWCFVVRSTIEGSKSK